MTNNPLKCLNGHAFEKVTGIPQDYTGLENMTVTCDSCGLQGLEKTAECYSHCPFCSYDVCLSCCPDVTTITNASSISNNIVELDYNHFQMIESKETFNSPSYGMTEFVSHKSDVSANFAPVSLLKGKINSFDSVASNYTFAGTILYSRMCTQSILNKWPKEISLSIDSFGDMSAFFSFLRLVYSEGKLPENSSNADSILSTLKGTIQEILRSKKKQSLDLADSIIGFSTHHLSESLKFLTSMKKTKAHVIMKESTHPYDNNLDDYYSVSIPGAKYILVVFDKLSSSESKYDFVNFYKDISQTSKWNDTPYSGSASNCPYWAGLPGADGQIVPPLKIYANKFYVHFHSDGSNNDFGYKFYCYGIMDEMTDEEKEDADEFMNNYIVSANFSCWLLEILCHDANQEIIKKIFYPKTIRYLRRFIDIAPWDKKLNGIYLVIDIAHQVHKVKYYII